MKVRWEYEGKQYVISGHRNGRMYLNKHPYDCTKLLKALESGDEELILAAKIKAKIDNYRLCNEHYHGKPQEPFVLQHNPIECFIETLGEFMLWLLKFIAVAFGICFWGYVIYQIWWFFIGEWAFEGPFADDISAGEVIMDTIMYIVAFIAIIGGYFGRK